MIDCNKSMLHENSVKEERFAFKTRKISSENVFVPFLFLIN